MNLCSERTSLLVTHSHHVEIAVDLCVILLNLVLNLTKSQLLFTPVDLFILKKKRRYSTEIKQMEIKVKSIQVLSLQLEK